MQQAAQADNQKEEGKSFSNKPTVLADNGHGTKVKLWSNGPTMAPDKLEFPTSPSSAASSAKATTNGKRSKCGSTPVMYLRLRAVLKRATTLLLKSRSPNKGSHAASLI
jgi:hypothetical protein